MANCVLVQTAVSAMNIDARNRVGVAKTALGNGVPVVCKGLSKDKGQAHVFEIEPASEKVKDIWLTYSPEVNSVVNGENSWRGLDLNPLNFEVPAGKPIDIFKPEAGVDIIQVTAGFFDTGKDPKTVSGATYVEIQEDGKFDAVASATPSFEGAQFKVLGAAPIIIANGGIGGEAHDAWLLECTIN